MTRLGVEHDPERLLELRGILSELMRQAVPISRGISYQESRLPPTGGPPDCMLCWAAASARVPVSEQRIFEDGLRQTGKPTNVVYEIPEFKPKHPNTGKGWIVVTRGKHSDHIDQYPNWRAKPNS